MNSNLLHLSITNPKRFVRTASESFVGNETEGNSQKSLFENYDFE